jgi:hypothetical protein
MAAAMMTSSSATPTPLQHLAVTQSEHNSQGVAQIAGPVRLYYSFSKLKVLEKGAG